MNPMRGSLLSCLASVVALFVVASNSAQGGPPSFVRQGRLPSAEIKVEFGSQSVLIGSTLDVSNVALEYEDGSVQRYEGLQGRRLEIGGSGRHAGKSISRVWVKAGPNLSGWGPGLGQMFERPAPPPVHSKSAVKYGAPQSKSRSMSAR